MSKDLVSVIRCRSCKFAKPFQASGNYQCKKFYNAFVFPSDFCSKGELKNGYEENKNQVF